MRERGRFRIGLIIGLFFGIVVAFAAIPLFTERPSFLKGFLTAVVFVAGVLVIRTLVNRKIIHSQFSYQTEQRFTRFFGVVIIVFGLALVGLLLLLVNDWMTREKMFREDQLKAQSELSESIQKTGLLHLMANVLDQADSDIKTLPGRKLSDETISRIASVSYAFAPYVSVEGDTISDKKLSAERGLLLLAIAAMDLDTLTWKKITYSTSFVGADLENTSLKGLNLSGANLLGANMKNADLHGANLEATNLSYSNLWGSKLRYASLKGADMRRADLRWSDLSYANLQNANLNGADLSLAQVQNADFTEALIQWARLAGSILKNSDFTKADFFGTTLERAQLKGSDFSEANFTQAYLIDANFNDASIKGADFSRANVGVDWFELLKNWNSLGWEEIVSQYSLSQHDNIYRIDKVAK